MNRKFTTMAVLMCVCLVVSNIFEVKVFHIGALELTGGFVLFPITYILNDCITELYGYRNARYVILLAFAINLSVVAVSQLVRILPSDPGWDGGKHFDYIFNTNARICLASALAFITGSLMNAKIMARMKVFQGEKGFGLRAVASSLVGETADSLIFFPIAFWGAGLKLLLTLMLTQIVLKTLYEVLVLPLTTLVVNKLKD